MQKNQQLSLSQKERSISFFLTFSLCIAIILIFIQHELILLTILFFSAYIYYKYRPPLLLGPQTKKILYLFLAYYGFFLLHILINSLFWWGIEGRTRADLPLNALGLLGAVYLLNILKVDSIFIHRVLLTLSATIIVILVFEPIYYSHLTPPKNPRLGYYFSDIGEFGWTAGSTMLFVIIYACYSLKHNNYRMFMILLGLSLPLLIATVLSGTRSFWLSLPFAGIFLLYILWKIKLYSIKPILLIVALCIAVSMILINTNNPVSKGIDGFKYDMAKIQQGDLSGSVGQRISMYIISSDLIKKNLWWGIGDINYRNQFKQAIENHPKLAKGDAAEHMAEYSHVHNHFLMDFLNRGIIGLLLSIAALLLPMISFFKVLKNHINQPHHLCFWYALGGCLFMIGSFVFFQFSAILYYSHGLAFFWLALFLFSMGIDHATVSKTLISTKK